MQIQIENVDPSTEEGWAEIVTRYQERLKEWAKEEEYPLFDVIILMTQDPWTGVSKNATLRLSAFFVGDDDKVERDKSAFARLAYAMSYASRSIGVLCMSECTMRQKDRFKDGLFISADHRQFGSKMLLAELLEGRSMGDWEELPGALGGRFGNLLPPDDMFDPDVIEYGMELSRKIIEENEKCLLVVEETKGEQN